MCPNCKCVECQKIIAEEKSKEFMRRLKQASEVVSTWAKWKQDILKGKP
jgi:hypothetical protein